MLDHDTRQTLEPAGMGSDDEGWLTSYLDVLTLLITLFVLLLALTPAGSGEAAKDQITPGGAVPTSPLAQRSTGIMPRHDGIQPQFSGLSIPGVSVDQGREGVTLRIDDSLLFASGQAQLTSQGRGVIGSLVEVLESFEGQISIEGHTDNIPISTARFPSNWELSAARAIAVLRHLEGEGMDVNRMRAVGYADTQPMQDNAMSEGRAANRRVELLLRQVLGS
ncbi:OmpA family protein [Vreelandella rituensis]|uniref:Flagellar motor protein MotB n=1 Tax=Vreelandella rituensis TaxID=2282306 RepID=A0A368U4W2_9GAMM|nr:OmpA family protein [Halomonas rituensis]RCV92044.1 flagellar motor protein MotB [Halomonas rituensis]